MDPPRIRTTTDAEPASPALRAILLANLKMAPEACFSPECATQPRRRAQTTKTIPILVGGAR